MEYWLAKEVRLCPFVSVRSIDVNIGMSKVTLLYFLDNPALKSLERYTNYQILTEATIRILTFHRLESGNSITMVNG